MIIIGGRYYYQNFTNWETEAKSGWDLNIQKCLLIKSALIFGWPTYWGLGIRNSCWSQLELWVFSTSKNLTIGDPRWQTKNGGPPRLVDILDIFVSMVFPRLHSESRLGTGLCWPNYLASRLVWSQGHTAAHLLKYSSVYSFLFLLYYPPPSSPPLTELLPPSLSFSFPAGKPLDLGCCVCCVLDLASPCHWEGSETSCSCGFSSQW